MASAVGGLLQVIPPGAAMPPAQVYPLAGPPDLNAHRCAQLSQSSPRHRRSARGRLGHGGTTGAIGELILWVWQYRSYHRQ